MLFEAFHRTHGAPVTYRDASDEAMARLSQRLPAELVELFRADGFAVYGGGLFSTVDDRDVEAARASWLPSFPQISLFGHGAFGELFIWDGGTVQILLPHLARVGFVTGSITGFFEETLTRPTYIEHTLRKEAAANAERLVGPLAWDEMYGYEPAIALGGSGEPDTIRRYKLVEHHILLSQLQELEPLL